jgi:geranylgeranyl reductase family protein
VAAVPVPAFDVDVLVVGGGPAGSAAATVVARAGRSVLVVDKARFPRNKCCGDGLTTLALRLLRDLGLSAGAVGSWHDVDGAWIRSPSGREVHVPLPRGRGRYAAVASRLDLDAALLRLAGDAGATVVQGAAFRTLDTSPDGAHVDVVVESLGRVRARYVVAADGMWSPVRKAVGLAEPGYLGEWHAARQYVSGVTGPAAERLYVWFDEDLLPGYAWSFPLAGGRANVGYCVLRGPGRHGRDHRATSESLGRRPHVAAALGDGAHWEARMTAWPIPARIDQAATGIGRVLFVGDAVRAPDVMTGEGIGQALLTGIEAAHAVLRAGATRPDDAQQQYRQVIRHELVADHRMSLALSKVLTHPVGARGALRVVAHSGTWGRERFARWMFEDEPRAVIVTPSRWHRGFLARPGT